jgi:peptidoglycan hydrolase-like protein with peptidoglycan-binding domain
MYIQNNNSFAYSPSEDRAFTKTSVKDNIKQIDATSFKGFSEKAVLTFENLTARMSPKDKSEATQSLNNIGKAAAFASVNGYNSNTDRQVITQYFENFGGYLSDDEIKKMISIKLDTKETLSKEFLFNFSLALDEPLQRINIKI